jgi:hypothetical protein
MSRPRASNHGAAPLKFEQATNDVEYGGLVPASTGGPQPREAGCPLGPEELVLTPRARAVLSQR